MAVDLDLAYLPATAMAERIRGGALTATAVVANSLARIAETQPTLNGFCFACPDEAMARAEAADRAVAAGRPLGPLHGVPFAIKDLTPTKGLRTTLGSKTHEHWVPDEDAPIVTALLAAGGILVGKTTTPEFAHAGYTDSPLWGVTRNPWNPTLTCGGSSGGAGVAVAAGCVPLAEGSDMGGSVRIPAAFCGTVGLKPSFGRIPFTILPSVFDQLSHFGPLARTIDDAALFLAVTQGPDERDIQSLKPPLTIELPLPARDLRGVRLAFSPDLGYCHVDPAVAANTRAAVETLAGLGAEIEEVRLPWGPDLNEAWAQHWGVYLAAWFGHLLPEHRSVMDPRLVKLMEAGLAMNAVDFKRLEIRRTRQWQSLAPILERCKALLCPTMPILPPPAEGVREDEHLDADGLYHAFDFTEVFNLVSPCPALSVPSGWTPDGLPTALQIVGRRFDDLGVLAIGKALEQARPWADRRPPV
jgi:Asp-tRNA(Asn)/Glu-tRNA(Gln) amidotransferase A subunit family amidase